MDLGSPIAIGNTAKIYRCQNTIVKLLNDDLPETEALYEADKQNFAYSRGLSVPKILDVKKIDGKQAIIMEYKEGRTMGELLSKNKERLDDYMTIFVEVQQQIHQVEAHSLESMAERVARQIERAPFLDPKTKPLIIQKLERMSHGEHLCHGDFHFYNVLMSNNKVTILDWVDACSGDIRADIYRTYLLYSQVSDEWANKYLNVYCDKSGLTKEEIFEWAPILSAARLAEKVPTDKPERLLKIVNSHLN